MSRPTIPISPAALILLATLSACGGGGGSTTPPPTATPTFTLTVSPASLQIPAGGSGFVTVTASRLNGFQGAITVTGVGFPAGTTASGSMASNVGTLQLPIVVGAGVAPTTLGNLQIEGRSGSLTQTASFSLTVKAALPPNQISVDLTQAPGAFQQVGSLGNQVVVAEPFRATTATSPSGTTQIRHGFLPSGSPLNP